MIYRVTYLSDGLRVAGYVALPPELQVTAQQIQAFLRRECGDDELTAQAVACVLPSAAESAESAKSIEPERRYPVFVYCRGGIGSVGRVRLDWLAEFASFGRIVVAPCYRGGESGVGHDRFGGVDLEDSRVAVRLAQAIPFADPAQIAVMGFSRGSINGTDAAIHEGASHLILWGGLSDLGRTYEERIDLRRMLKRVLQGSVYKIPETYAERSPIHMASRIACPVLIVHGTEDQQVDYGHARRMYEELQRLGKPADLITLDGLGHHMPQPVRMDVLAKMFAWLDRSSMNGK
ncbi:MULTISPECIES: alpha/beta hydrolase family protein [Saccharibacillus]|uniref:alpha/beta hydrolase family protein n=1 Tax=Saccharibacillus TaxID=456492 RepID=UPI001238E0E4|nr:prolyl oligopeptidase family serine peptidase [Saccharibacillus sp. WB 17]MWJ33892.1 prolyl oligopeptidase family serine peptidase [Saccharibacillus sp. WB 17]